VKLKVLLLMALIITTGCSHQPPLAPQSGSWTEHQQLLAAYDQWQLQGKLGFKSSDRGGSANLNWTQNRQQYQVQLSGPLGAGNVVIAGDHTSAQMQQGERYYVAAPEVLAARFTGLPIPVDALSWWVRGLPNPNQTAPTELINNPDGTALGFDQQGWQLRFSRYQMTSAGLLPRKISGQLGDQSFKLVISRWNSPE
jgi:outer membrane lipoprotein LolB